VTVNIHFLRSPKPRNAVLDALYAHLHGRGLEVSESIPDGSAHDLDLEPEYDLYVLKARGPLAVSLASVLLRRGARVLNHPAACGVLLDKVVATAMLRHAGLPAPRTWAVTDAAALRTEAFAARLPLIVKPHDGIASRSVELVTDRDGLAALHGWPSPRVAQEFIQDSRYRYKIHVVGERVFATRKAFSLGGDPGDGTPIEPGDEITSIARRCGRLFGLVLYGLDVLIGRDGPVVVDVNSFPGYAGVNEAPEALADLISETARGRLELTPR
jgi:ribosomal protein S6--L-glutamate ligase